MGSNSIFKTNNFQTQFRSFYLVFIAIVIGIGAGIGNIIFRFAISLVHEFSFGTSDEALLPHLELLPVWQVALVPAAGGLIVGLIYYITKLPKGVPMILRSLIMKAPVNPWTGVATVVASAVTLGTGGSAGREGPIVQIGAAIGSAIGKLFRLSSNRMRFAIASGAGGGLAATFNTPMAGAMFTAEVLLGKLEFQVFAPVVISCVSATVVSRAYFGNHVTFITPEYVLTNPVELIIYAVLGVIIGIAGALFIKLFFCVGDVFNKIKIPVWLKPALGGLIIGLCFRSVMGVGYGTIAGILDERLIGWSLLGFLGLKMFATSITLGSGGAGGQFVPSLFTGAALGGFVGWVAHMFFPEYASTSSSYALVGMAAMLAATIRAPVTAILMVFEITQNYQVVLPLMVATIIAHICASLVEKDSFFTKPLSRQGFDVRHGTEIALLGQVHVRDVMVKDIVTFYEETPFSKILEDIQKKPHEYFPVLDHHRILKGVISLKDIKQVLFDQNVYDVLVASDFSTRENLIVVRPDDTLADALAIMGDRDIGDLPVVIGTDPENMQLVGLLRRSDILTTYNKKVLDLMHNEV